MEITELIVKCLPEDMLLEYDRQWINICLAKVKN